MTTIKNYTDLQQSKELAEILPIESTDMYYAATIDATTLKFVYTTPPRVKQSDHAVYKTDIPCWSLAALLSVLPNNKHVTTTVSRGSWKIEPIEYLPNDWWCEYEDTKNQTELNVSADNPVDACYEMIIKLNELKML